MTETLFSLEIHVESVENLRVSCKLPAFCFRLLDFPTMIIHHVSPMEAEKLRRRLRLEDKDTLLHELKDRFGNFQFRKGKSCLFKASIDTLLVQLQTVPMYAMLMDLWPRKPALVGSTLIPLKKAIDKISADVYQKGIAVPSLYRDEGEFDVYNLMGSCIATVKLGFRLLSLGGTLIPHIPTEALATTVQKVETGVKMEQAVKSALEKVLPEIKSKSLFEEEIPAESIGGETDGEIDTALQKQDIKHNVEVQTNICAKDIKSSRTLDQKRRESEEDVVISNTFCPPPLYYNYFSNSAPSTQSSSSENKVCRNAQTVHEDPVSHDVDFVYYDPGLVHSDGTVKLASISVQTDEKLSGPAVGLESAESQAEVLHRLYNVKGLTSASRLPVLNALLQELSCLTGRQQVTDTAQPSSLSSQPKSTVTSRQQQVPRRPPTVTKSEVYKKQSQSAAPSKRAQSSVIGLSSRRVHFKQTSLTYGMTKTQKMRLELNQKDKTANRTRPCEAHAALAEKENVKRDSIRTVLRESGLGMTYRIGSTKRSTVRGMKQSVDAQNQTQPVVEQLTHENGVAQSSTLDIKEETGVKLKEEIAKQAGDIVHSTVQSARNSKSPNSLEVFIPQVQGEPEEKSDQESEWVTDQHPSSGLPVYGHTGIISPEHDDRGGGSAMTMYTEDFEDSGTEDSQKSFHLPVAFTRSNSAENNLKPRSNDDSSVSGQSQGSSVSSTRPVRSSRSPSKTKSRRLKTKVEGSQSVEHKISISQEDYDSMEGWAPMLDRGLSDASDKHAEESEGSYTDDFHSVASELENNPSDSASLVSVDAGRHRMLDLPPAANNLGYTY